MLFEDLHHELPINLIQLLQRCLYNRSASYEASLSILLR
jgi:hypothetical protein